MDRYLVAGTFSIEGYLHPSAMPCKGAERIQGKMLILYYSY